MSGKQLFWDFFSLGRVDSISLGPGSDDISDCICKANPCKLKEDASKFLHILGILSSISLTIYQFGVLVAFFVFFYFFGFALFFFLSLLLRSYSFSHYSMVIKANKDKHLNRLQRARFQLFSLFLFQNQDPKMPGI